MNDYRVNITHLTCLRPVDKGVYVCVLLKGHEGKCLPNLPGHPNTQPPSKVKND